jgi:hypothetical protein
MVLALAIVALVCAPALAQQRRGGGGFGFGQGASLGTLAANESVQKELKMDADQVKKSDEALKKLRDDLKDDYAKLGGGGRRGGGGGGGNNVTPEERTAARKKTGEAEEKALTDVLKPDQLKRIQQIQVQQEGLAAFQTERVQKALNLSDEQKTKIKDISDAMQKEMRDMFQGGGGGGGRNPETQQKIQALRKDALANAVKTLNDDQKKTFKDLTGEAFELVRPMGRGGKPRTDF